MNETQLAILFFAIMWVATFLPVWYLFSKLIVYSLRPKQAVKSLRFWVSLVIYLSLLALPYLLLLQQADTFSSTFKAVLYGLLIFIFAVPLAQIFLSKRIESLLWGLYGYVYDGLLHFYPYKNLVDEAVKRLKIKNNDQVLDLGCGTGNASLKILLQEPKFLQSVDGSSSMLRPAKAKLADFQNVKIYKQDAVEYLRQLESKSLNKILLINVLYAVHNGDELWQELLRVLKDDGLIVMTSSDRGGSLALIKDHLRHASIFQLMHPKLVAVFAIDSLISIIASSGNFHFISQQEMINGIEAAGGKATSITRCYGGEKDGVNLMMTIYKV